MSTPHPTGGGAAVDGLRQAWRDAAGYQRLLAIVGGVLIASSVFHTGVLVVTGGTLAGDVSWRKPITFGESFGLTAVTAAWILGFLPRWRRLGWLLAGTLALSTAGEVAWVSLQQWRGVPSHFNTSTAFDTAAFNTAGGLIALAVLALAALTLASFVALRAAPAPLPWAIRSGLVLLLVGLGIGIRMIAIDGHAVGAGDLKVPHAFGVHAAQVLPGLGWLLAHTTYSAARRNALLAGGALGYAALVGTTLLQALGGRAVVDASPLEAVVLLAGAVGLVLAFVAAGRDLTRPIDRAPVAAG